ncbi:MAG: hypothetical protein RIM99_04435 [Cyclobacteriaceae bacterium]
MDLKDHNQNLKIIGKVLLVLGLVLVPVSMFSFFFLEAFQESDFWLDFDDVDVFFLHIRKPQNILYFFPVFYTIISAVFITTGIGLAGEKSWGKKFAMVPAVLLLFEFPIGTALGLYMIYALHTDTESTASEA